MHLYLQPDIYSDLAIAFTNTGVFKNFRGALDANGRATASLVIPPSLVTGAITLHHAYAVYLTNTYCTGNPVRVELK